MQRFLPDFPQYMELLFLIKVYPSTLGAGNDLHSDLHTAVIACQFS